MLFGAEDKSNATFDGSEYVLHQQKHRGYCFVQKTVVSLLSHISSHISVDDCRGKPGDSFDVFQVLNHEMWHDKGRVGEGSGSFLVLGHIRIPANQATRLKTKSTLETYLFCQDCGLRT